MKKYFVFVIVIAICLACSNDETPTIEYPKCDYFPLQVGNKWYYKSSTTEITGKETINDQEWFIMTKSYVHENQEPTIYRIYYRKTEDGKVYQKSDENNDSFLVFDLKIGFKQSWKYTDGDNQWKVSTGDDFETIKLEDSSITNCRSYYYDIPEAVDDEHVKILAPGLGLISSSSLAWGFSDTLQRAVINGLEVTIK